MANVAVIGAGVAGLTAAYRLVQAGHSVTVLEAKPHAGGLSQTARAGTIVTELDDRGREVHQTATLDPGLHLNLGPGRLPHHHRHILELCQHLEVPLEPYIMSSDANWWVDARTGRRYRRRWLEHDARGHVAELAHLTTTHHAVRDLIRSFGDLTPSGAYAGTHRGGGAPPIPLTELARLRFWDSQFWQPASYLWQDTMFQPVGGMDTIWRALLQRVIKHGGRVVYNAAVERIRTTRKAATVTWRHAGVHESAPFDWCLSSIPLPLLAQLRLQGFDRDMRSAIATPAFAPACKVGWQTTSRWWESDSEQIYGGISYTNHIIGQFWYPSSGFGTAAATLTGAYNYYEAAARFAERPVRDRIALARRGGALIHPEVADDDLTPASRALTVAWHRVPFQAGGWCDWVPHGAGHKHAFERLQHPDGRFVVIGDQVSQWPGWQEGCVVTADRAVRLVDVAAPAPAAHAAPGGHAGPPVTVPDSAWLTTGDHPEPASFIQNGSTR